ncbi:Acyl-CoA dehydrogenase [uncultured Mycobacterium sp.]|uniref:Acyl-CoA dehydrogenase n=1 Tax=uncultured Mycobacterium sp. TaxID=171292 RepID=A0A1Y5PK36_9MYCO|nr:Acyl-CoA dehydrogenase [uncultured Mycobacterium sp.]
MSAMFDERWPRDAEELGEALAAVLAKHCPPDALRALDDSAPGDLAYLRQPLDDFGLWDLPTEPLLLVRAAVTLGEHLAPVPFVSAVPAYVVLGERSVANGVDRDIIPAGLDRVVVAVGDGIGIAAPSGPVRRSAAGEGVMVLGALTPEAIDGDADALRAWGFLLEAAQLVGAAQALIRYGVGYVSERRQFGAPVGSFQGVAHPLAEVATAVHAADLLTRHAAFLADTDGRLPLFAAAMAAAKARSASRQAAATVHQALGGYGFTIEADAQLYSRRIRGWSAAMPDPGPWLADLARMLADPATRDTVTDLWQFDRGFTLPRWARESG